MPFVGVRLGIPGASLGGVGVSGPKLAPVTIRTFLPNQSGGGTNTDILSLTNHVLFSDVLNGQIEIWWPNWYMPTGSGSVLGGCAETLPGAAATATANITYYDATTGALVTVNLTDKTGGTTALSAADGGYFQAVATINAKAGSRIFPKIAGHFPNGMMYAQWQADINNGDLFQFGGSSIPLSNTPTNSFASNLAYYGPCSIRAITKVKSAALIGDSRGSGLADVANDSYGNIGNTGRLLGKRMPYVNVSAPGQTAGDFALFTQTTRSRVLAQQCDYVAMSLGVNDIMSQGQSAAATLTLNQSIVAALGKPAFYVALDPETNSANSATTSSGGNTQRLAYNVSVRAGNCYDPPSILEASGLWASTTYCVVDSGSTFRVHETNTGNQLAADTAGFNYALVGSPSVLSLLPWTPAVLGTTLLHAWFKPTTATVSAWPDSSGNTTGFAQASGTLQPTVNVAAGGLTFTSSQKMEASGISSGVAGATEIVIACITLPAFSGNTEFLQSNPAGPGREIRVDSIGDIIVNNQGVAQLFAPSGTITANVKQFFTFIGAANGNTMSGALNGGTPTVGSGATGFTGTGDTVLGPFGNASGAGSVHEQIYLSTSVTTNQRQQAEGYLAWNQGIQSVLPGGHPYKSAAPTL